jgi:hypothetical protein
MNLYGFVGNNGIGKIDPIGLTAVAVWNVEKQGPEDDFDEENSGIGGFLWVAQWSWKTKGTVTNDSVSVISKATINYIGYSAIADYAYVRFECDQDSGDIKEVTKESGGSTTSGSLTTAAKLESTVSGDTATVEFSGAAAYKGSISANGFGVTLAHGGDGRSGNGTASFKCICTTGVSP